MIKTAARQPNEEAMGRLRAIRVGTAEAHRKIDRDAYSIAAAMQSVHGGEWRVKVDHDAGFVLVCCH